MSAYRVMFFKTLPNSYGKTFEVCQRTIDVPSASSPDNAVEQAKQRFEQCEDISSWRIHADYFQVDVLSAPTPDDFRATYRAPAIPVTASLPTAITRITSDTRPPPNRPAQPQCLWR